MGGKAGVAVRRLRAEEWELFRALRLESLQTDHLAFGSTHARELEYPRERWQRWATEGASGGRRATFVAEDVSGRLVGMSGVFDQDDRFVVWGMWVRPSSRGQGLGARLLDAVLAWVERSFPGSSVVLSVNPNQEAAVRTYRSHGFEFTGQSEPLGHDPPATCAQMARPAPSQG